MDDLISRAAAIAEIEEYIEEYSELEPETGYHNLKWCAMEEAKDVLSMLPTIDAIPVEWLEKKRENLIFAAMVNSTVYGDNSIELCHAVNVVLDMWQKEQEVQDEKAK